jgi:hypothetical protein
MVIGDLAVADDHVMREHAAHRFVEAAADGFLRHLEVVPGLGAAGVQFRQRLLDKMQRGRRRIGLEVSAGAVALDGVAPLGNLPLELDSGEFAVLGR